MLLSNFFSFVSSWIDEMTSTKKKEAAEYLRDLLFCLPSRADTTETVESWFPEVVSLMCLLSCTSDSQIFMVIQSFVSCFQ